MKLRPHHILCIQKFTGHGYDEAFTAHMTGLVSLLGRQPETVVTLTQGCDDLCAVCPNNTGGACATLQKVDGMDRGVLDICGLAYGVQAPWGTLAPVARKRIFESDKFGEICGSCQWFSLCVHTK